MKQTILTSGLERWPRQQSRMMSEAEWEVRLPPLRALWVDLLAGFVLCAVAIVLYRWMP